MRSLRIAAMVMLSAAVFVGCQSDDKGYEPLPAPPPVPRREPLPPPPGPRPTPTPRPSTGTGKSIRSAVFVIDAGHGGKDPGAWKKTKSSTPEKTIVLDIANRVASSLRSRGARVVSTRTSDVYVELDERAAIAERNRADLFVSIHADSAQRASASGVGIHIHTDPSAASRNAAQTLCTSLRHAGIGCRGVQRSNFHVLREHNRPSMLIECGYLTNTDDARKLNNASYRAQLADAIADGIASRYGP